MKFAFSTNAFRKHSFPEAAEAVATAGYDGIEIMCDRPHAFPGDMSTADVDALGRTLSDNGLEIANLNGFMMCAVGDFHRPSWVEPDETYREMRVQYILDCIDLAARLGAKTISTEPGGPRDLMPRQQALEVFARGLGRVLPKAREKGVAILIEPEPDLLIQTADEFLEFMGKYGEEGLGLNFDIGHFYCVGDDPAARVGELYPYTFHYHLEDIAATREHRHLHLGEGAIDIPNVLKIIESQGWDGFITVELYTYLDAAPETARRSRAYLRDVCGYKTGRLPE